MTPSAIRRGMPLLMHLPAGFRPAGRPAIDGPLTQIAYGEREDL
ncbi:hypothetical protein FHX80_112719 [Streptomyces brevispora]|uniref:Uncharacterized protein n=1 Tax=Streptomyces brevispora TaxID=887462 RepID=A0A561UY33_9ACTN|nr:hypothetical protein FHX80_112719 [Streptomyces brevispora]